MDALPLTDGQLVASPLITERRTGALNVQIANAAVQVYRAQTGRGPTKSRTYIQTNLVVVELRETLTHGERNLVAAGQSEVVRKMRRAYRALIHEQLVDAIEWLLDRKVLALLSDSHLDPDVAVEVFVLEPDS
ncbi:MAG: Na-translocating system protein MpsC family protein [Solirubrobacteraceae bacterium]